MNRLKSKLNFNLYFKSKWKLFLVLAVTLFLLVSVSGCVEEQTMDDALEVVDLKINPSISEVDELLTIQANITNTDNEAGDYEVYLEKNSDVVKTSTITLNPGETKQVSFEHQISETGLYNITIADKSTEIRIVEGEIESLNDIKTIEFKTMINDSNETHIMVENPATEDLKIKIDIIEQDITVVLNLESDLVHFKHGTSTITQDISLDEVESIEDLVEVFEDLNTFFGFFMDFNIPITDLIGELDEDDVNETTDLVNETDLNGDLNESVEQFIDKIVDEIVNAEDPYIVDEITFKDPVHDLEIKVFDIKINEGFPDNTFVFYA
ncbi:putative S-layer protein containing OB-fold domain [Methanonatronarchaeum thermophilum]|uniref:Putative S-layer protein containing OB-fold domain n=1 Tax=Methanonatronarchaeum thermophilum TaxID=1927129 RepID=A0A1Y3GCU6_9EURY|nr:CARDB domain-containing protein [Methanonatronarchaeum thermophilum]OUJ19067.1 putative S-layer protein containing OB-fold domain [Methanonatronarchaeum thermophilum]